MLEFIEGKVEGISPVHMVINANGVGHFAHISLYAYEVMRDKSSVRLLVHLSIKEDSHTLYGFHSELERTLFRMLISVSGVGPSTARVIISSLSENEIISAITNRNVALLKSIKGIGPKAAERLILELRDKASKLSIDGLEPLANVGNQQEAVDALMALGFTRASAEKAVVKVGKDETGNNNTEELIKRALKVL